MSQHLALALVATATALLLFAQPIQAQEPTGEPGDYFWQLRANGLLADGRIEQALILMVEPEAVIDAAGVDGALLYGQIEKQAILDETTSADSPLLFEAAGFDDPATQVTVRECRFWTPGGAGETERSAVGVAIGEALAAGLAALGVEIDGCEQIADPEGADLFVWQFGQDVEVPAGELDPDGDSFLAADLELPGAIPGGNGGGGVTPPAGGDAGLLDAKASALPGGVAGQAALLAVLFLVWSAWPRVRRA